MANRPHRRTNFRKRLLASPAAAWLVSGVVSGFVRFVHASGRWSWRGDEEAIEALFAKDAPIILCFWHGRMAMMPMVWRTLPAGWRRGRNAHMLLSNSRDGRIVNRIATRFGIRPITGSSSRGGTPAMLAMLTALQNGDYVAVTPDGPRGPGMRVNGNIIQIAKRSGAVLVPATFSCTHGWSLDTWDRFLVPRPFTNGVLVWGEPVEIGPDDDEAALERARARLEEELMAVNERADREMGRVPARSRAGAAAEYAPAPD